MPLVESSITIHSSFLWPEASAAFIKIFQGAVSILVSLLQKVWQQSSDQAQNV